MGVLKARLRKCSQGPLKKSHIDPLLSGLYKVGVRFSSLCSGSDGGVAVGRRGAGELAGGLFLKKMIYRGGHTLQLLSKKAIYRDTGTMAVAMLALVNQKRSP